MAAVVSSWESLSALATAMQNAVPGTFSKVEIAESGDYAGQLVAYDDDNNICFRLVNRGNFTLCFRDGSTIAFTSNWDISEFGVCANGVILVRGTSAYITIAKDHRGKIAFHNTNGSIFDFIAYNGESSSSSEAFSYGSGEQKDQTNLCRMMLPKAGTDTNYFEHGYVSQQYNLNTSPMVCQIAGNTFISCYRIYLMDE